MARSTIGSRCTSTWRAPQLAEIVGAGSSTDSDVESSGGSHGVQQAQHGDEQGGAHAGFKAKDGEIERLLEACNLMDKQPEARATWYHPDCADLMA